MNILDLITTAISAPNTAAAAPRAAEDLFFRALGNVRPMESYPSQNDVDFARNSGFGYGSGNEAFLSGGVGRVIKEVPGTFPDRSRQAASTRPEYLSGGQQKDFSDQMTAAALAANRLPIAALGFDPRVMGVNLYGRKTNLGGEYSPSMDTIYANPNASRSGLLHESIHRGIKMLRDAGDKDAASIKGTSWNGQSIEENVVRFIMSVYGGDEERDFLGNKAVNDARSLITNNPHLLTAITRMMVAAQNKMAADRPRGPR